MNMIMNINWILKIRSVKNVLIQSLKNVSRKFHGLYNSDICCRTWIWTRIYKVVYLDLGHCSNQH
jgi:hypothetical protein